MDILKEVREQYPRHNQWGALAKLARMHYVATGDRQSLARYLRAKEKSENMSCSFAMEQAKLHLAVSEAHGRQVQRG